MIKENYYEINQNYWIICLDHRGCRISVLMSGIVGPLTMAGLGFESFIIPARGGRSFGLSVFALTAILLKDRKVYLSMFIASIGGQSVYFVECG